MYDSTCKVCNSLLAANEKLIAKIKTLDKSPIRTDKSPMKKSPNKNTAKRSASNKENSGPFRLRTLNTK